MSDHAGLAPATPARPNPIPLAGSFMAGLIASLCCGGSLIFASIGLGAFYSGLGLFRYVPQALAAGALSILAINYLSYRRAAKRASHGATVVRVKMFVSTTIGLIVMAGTFTLLEWLNHAVIHGDRFLARPEFSEALIKGVPNVELLYVFATFFTIAVLWALPFPRGAHVSPNSDSWMSRAMRVAVFGAGVVLVIGVVLDATPWARPSDGASHQHGRSH
jgi:fucose permease